MKFKYRQLKKSKKKNVFEVVEKTYSYSLGNHNIDLGKIKAAKNKYLITNSKPLLNKNSSKHESKLNSGLHNAKSGSWQVTNSLECIKDPRKSKGNDEIKTYPFKISFSNNNQIATSTTTQVKDSSMEDINHSIKLNKYEIVKKKSLNGILTEMKMSSNKKVHEYSYNSIVGRSSCQLSSTGLRQTSPLNSNKSSNGDKNNKITKLRFRHSSIDRDLEDLYGSKYNVDLLSVSSNEGSIDSEEIITITEELDKHSEKEENHSKHSKKRCLQNKSNEKELCNSPTNPKKIKIYNEDGYGKCESSEDLESYRHTDIANLGSQGNLNKRLINFKQDNKGKLKESNNGKSPTKLNKKLNINKETIESLDFGNSICSNISPIRNNQSKELSNSSSTNDLSKDLCDGVSEIKTEIIHIDDVHSEDAWDENESFKEFSDSESTINQQCFENHISEQPEAIEDQNVNNIAEQFKEFSDSKSTLIESSINNKQCFENHNSENHLKYGENDNTFNDHNSTLANLIVKKLHCCKTQVSDPLEATETQNADVEQNGKQVCLSNESNVYNNIKITNISFKRIKKNSKEIHVHMEHTGGSGTEGNIDNHKNKSVSNIDSGGNDSEKDYEGIQLNNHNNEILLEKQNTILINKTKSDETLAILDKHTLVHKGEHLEKSFSSTEMDSSPHKKIQENSNNSSTTDMNLSPEILSQVEIDSFTGIEPSFDKLSTRRSLETCLSSEKQSDDKSNNSFSSENVESPRQKNIDKSSIEISTKNKKKENATNKKSKPIFSGGSSKYNGQSKDQFKTKIYSSTPKNLNTKHETSKKKTKTKPNVSNDLPDSSTSLLKCSRNTHLVDTQVNTNATSSERSLNEVLDDIQCSMIFPEDDFKSLENLKINITWDLPLLHVVDNGSQKMTLIKLRNILGKNQSVLNTKKFIKEEEDKIKKNWEQFSKEYNFNNPELFFISRQLCQYLPSDERLKFKQYLARGLPNRRLHSVYYKFMDIYGVLKRGRWTDEEDQLLLMLYNEYEEKPKEIKFALSRQEVLQRALKRTPMSIHRRLKVLLRDEHATILTEMPLDWTDELRSDLVHYLLKYSHCKNSLEKLRHSRIPYKVWNRVAEKLDLNVDRIINHWKYQLYPQLFAKQPVLRHLLYIELIKWFYRSNIKHWERIDWSELSKKSGDLGSCFLYRCYKNLVQNYVPKELQKNFRASVVYLHESYLPHLLEKKTSRFLVRFRYNPDERMLYEVEEDEFEFPPYSIE